jgi:hypothetical protein
MDTKTKEIMKIKFEVHRIDARSEEFVGIGDTKDDCFEDALQQAYDYDYSLNNSESVEYEVDTLEVL